MHMRVRVWGVAAKVREGANMLPKVVEAEGKCERSHIRCSTILNAKHLSMVERSALTDILS